METLLKSVNTKLQMLEFTNEGVREALEKRHVPSMERKLKTLQDKIDEIQDLETKIQEAKIEKGENIQDIKEWSSKIESDISKYVACVAGGIRGHERMGSLKYRLPKNDTF